jgi:hypothetical protein
MYRSTIQTGCGVDEGVQKVRLWAVEMQMKDGTRMRVGDNWGLSRLTRLGSVIPEYVNRTDGSFTGVPNMTSDEQSLPPFVIMFGLPRRLHDFQYRQGGATL